MPFQGQRCSDGKHSKARLTGMAVSNALGEKILMFSIRKSASTRCSKHIHNLPCKYQSQKKAWMDGTLFKKWLHKLDHKFEMQGRNFMIVDIALPIQKFQNWKLSITIFATKYHFLYTGDGSGGNQVCLL